MTFRYPPAPQKQKAPHTRVPLCNLDGLATLVGQWRHQQLLPSALTAHQRHPLPAEMLFHLGH